MDARITPVVKNLLIINVLFYIAQLTFPITEWLALWPLGSGGFQLYQLITTGFHLLTFIFLRCVRLLLSENLINPIPLLEERTWADSSL